MTNSRFAFRSWLSGLVCLAFLMCAAPPPAGAEDPQTGDAFRVLDISERTYQNGPSIAVILSQALDPTRRHDDHIRISDEERLLKSAWVLSEDGRTLFFPHVEPETVYSVSILESLESAEGNKLGRRFFKALTTRKITPGVNFAGSGLVLPENLTDGLPVAVINVPAVEVEFFRLNDRGLRHFVRWGNPNSRHDYDEISRAREYGAFVYSGRYDLDPVRNKRVIRHIPVMDTEALREPGVYFAVLRRPGEYDYDYQATYFVVTDIGLHARVYERDALLLASSLKTGEPLAGVTLTFFDQKVKEIAAGVTDEQGRYRFSGNIKTKKISFIKAEKDGHVSVLPLEVPALDMSEFDLGHRRQAPRAVFVYSPRDMYRPGESVILSALLRDYDGRMTPAVPLTASLFRPDGRKVRGFTWRPEEFESAKVNYYQTVLDLPGDAQTGKWRLELRAQPDARRPLQVFTFSVEDFMPERMKLDLASEKTVVGAKDDWPIKVSGQYLYGAPAGGNRLEGMVRIRAKRNLFDALPGFQFGREEDRRYSDYWDLSDALLDKEGLTGLTVESRWEKALSPLAVRLTASLFETGGRPVTRFIERTIWPGPTLVGIRPMFDGSSVDEGAVRFQVTHVGPDGKTVPAKGLLIELIREDRDYYWEYSESRGWQHKYTEKIYKYLGDTLDVEGDQPAEYAVDLKRGRYVFAVKNPDTGLTTSIRFQVGYWWYDSDTLRTARPDKVQLALDKSRYQPGDVIKLTVTPPHSGDARIMVEGRTAVWFRRMPVSAKGTVVEIPVSAAWDSHDLYISALVFRPGDDKEKITPNRAVGLIHLPLDRSERKLELTVTAPEKVRTVGPTRMTARLKVDRLPEDRTFVTLAAVDVGILNITDFKTPDPFGWFFERRRFSVRFFDLYAKVVELLQGAAAKLRCGGDADTAPGGKRPETKVKLVSLFQGPVVFDENGEAEVTLTMPGDFNGRLRLMAVAFSGSSFGSGEKEVTVAAPIVTQLATPRFLSPGDEARFTLDIHNLSDSDQEVQLHMRAAYPLSLGEGDRTLALKDKEKTMLRFPVRAGYDFLPGFIKMDLQAGGVALEGEWQLGVRPGYPGVTRKIRRILKAGEAFELDRRIAEDLMPGSVDAGIKISTVIPLNLKQAMRSLISYPHGCLEQTSSRAYPLLYATPDAIERFKLHSIKQEERIKRLHTAVERIALMQVRKGGFGLWNARSPEEPWLTAYAADFLLQARERGTVVPTDMLDRALKRLDYYVNRQWPKKSNQRELLRMEFAVRSYAAWVLAKVGRAPLGSMRTLFDNHAEAAGSGLPLAQLGLAFKLMGDHERAEAALSDAARFRRPDNEYWHDYGSPLRDLALTAALFLENDVSEGLELMLLDLEEILRDRRWYSTQESYALFKLGLSLETRADKPWKGTLYLGGETVALDQQGAYVLGPTAKDIAAGISFASDTDRPLYLSVVVGGYTKTPPAMDDSLIALDREFYDLKGARVTRDEFTVGELLLVHLTINAKETLTDALLVDLLPAGFEIENPNFKYSVKIADTELEEIKIGKSSVWRLKRNNVMVHEEYHDDRYVAAMKVRKGVDYHVFYLVRAVSPGTYAVPPVFLESMYRPEIRGIGRTPPRITIVNRAK